MPSLVNRRGTFWFQIRVPKSLVPRYGALIRQNLSVSKRVLAQLFMLHLREKYEGCVVHIRAACTLVAVAVAGCSNPLYLRHDSKSNSSQEYFTDKTECELYANAAAPVVAQPDGIAGRDGEVWTTAYYDCMRGRGWYAVNESGEKIEYRWCEQIECFRR